MSDQKEREKYKPTEEEFIGDGLSEMKDSDASRDTMNKNQSLYEGRSLKELRREAREKGVTGFGAMEREQLVNTLKRM